MESEQFKSRPKKSLGQNYLVDENICRNIVNSFDIKPDDFIIEIGPGKGAITKYILEKTQNLVVVELDKSNCEILYNNFHGLEILNNDFLRLDLNEIKFNSQSETPNPKLRIIGNIPYNITTEIIFKLIENRNLLKDAQLMVQEEVSQRIVASPNSKEYGIPSVFIQIFSKPKLLFKVSGNCFYPKPKIDSRIIYFDFNNELARKIKDIIFFKTFVKAAFGNRRKTMRNSLKKLELSLESVDFDFGRRAESLSIEEFIELTNRLYQIPIVPLSSKERGQG